MNKYLVIFLCSASTWLCAAEPASRPEMALDRLLKGNERYVKELLEHPNRSQEHIRTVVESQSPIAAIVGCSDSRTSPVIIFDQGIGDLFEVRVAGNVVGPIEIASVEYAVNILNTPLIVVLGHENCGAIKAVLAHQTQDIEPIAELIESALKEAPRSASDNLESATKANVKAVVRQLRAHPAIVRQIAEKKVQVVGGYYNFNTGKVEILSPIPT